MLKVLPEDLQNITSKKQHQYVTRCKVYCRKREYIARKTY